VKHFKKISKAERKRIFQEIKQQHKNYMTLVKELCAFSDKLSSQ
jgi:hypothetical protein